MTPAEKLIVNRLATRIATLPDGPKDPEAAVEIKALIKTRPDAAYWLFQRCLALEVALEQANERAAQAERMPPVPQGFGASASSGPAPQARGTDQRPAGGGAMPGRGGAMAAQPGQGATGQGMPYPPPGAGGMPYGAAAPGGGGFMRNAMAMGAGVLGGSLLFHGIESMIGGHGHASGHDGDQASNHETPGAAPTETGSSNEAAAPVAAADEDWGNADGVGDTAGYSPDESFGSDDFGGEDFGGDGDWA